MKIVVTGGSGFLGSHIANELSERGHKVTIFDKKKSKWLRSDQRMCLGNILNYKELGKAIKGADYVFHFAALADLYESLKEPVKTVNLNILGTVYALELCKKFKVKRFIHASTIYVNSIEGGFYRSSKRAAEDYVEEFKKMHNLDYTILRFGSLYGEHSGDTNGVKKIVKGALLNKKIIYEGNKKAVRQYIHVLDAAKACCEILKDKYKNKHINLMGNKSIKVKIFLKKLAQLLKISKKIEFRNKKITGHYIVSPFTYKFKNGRNFKFKSSINFYEGLTNLIEDINTNKL